MALCELNIHFGKQMRNMLLVEISLFVFNKHLITQNAFSISFRHRENGFKFSKNAENQSTTKHTLPWNLFTKSTPNWRESVSNKEKKDTIYLCTNVSFHVVYEIAQL